MNQILKIGQTVRLDAGAGDCIVEDFLGGGGQGEVYLSRLEGRKIALKWYFESQATPDQRLALQNLISIGPPNDRFLWPLQMAASPGIPGFGYVMPLREGRYKGIVDLMKRRIDPSFQALALAGIALAHSYLQLHSKGLCYRDISFGNVFFDPHSGEILICDNDNVAVDGEARGGVLGTPRFMAPEVVRGEAYPSSHTDLFSLAVLLFYMFMVAHPLEGKVESQIKCFDLPAMMKIYGKEPVFIFDPANDTNPPVKGLHDNAIESWPIFPQFFRDLFTKTFTLGIGDPLNGRVRESEWRQAMLQLRDSILYCPKCGVENFYDVGLLQTKVGVGNCWSCKSPLALPFRIKIDRNVIMLNKDSKLYVHHIDPQRPWDLSQTAAEVSQHPTDPSKWGLKNLTSEKWSCVLPNGSMVDVEPGRNVALSPNLKIQFGKAEGEVRF